MIAYSFYFITGSCSNVYLSFQNFETPLICSKIKMLLLKKIFWFGESTFTMYACSVNPAEYSSWFSIGFTSSRFTFLVFTSRFEDMLYLDLTREDVRRQVCGHWKPYFETASVSNHLHEIHGKLELYDYASRRHGLHSFAVLRRIRH